MSRRYDALAAAFVVVSLVLAWMWHIHGKNSRDTALPSSGAKPSATVGVGDGTIATTVYAHNLRLRKGPSFQVYVRWIRGEMVPVRADRSPSLDDEESFVFAIDKGVIHANLEDIGKYLNMDLAKSSPLKGMSVSGEGNSMKLSGTLHKFLMPLPVELQATISPMPDGRIHLHVTKINVLKIPMKKLLGGLKVDIKDVVGSTPVDGVQVSGDDLYLDTTKLLPPPHIRGQVTSVTIQSPDVVVIYGSAPNDEAELAQWHNFLRLRGGTLRFGRLTMADADLTLIDASDDPWFDLDLANYQKQLVQGYSRMTADGGLEMFMPDVGQKLSGDGVSIDTLKNRNAPLPAAVPAAKR